MKLVNLCAVRPDNEEVREAADKLYDEFSARDKSFSRSVAVAEAAYEIEKTVKDMLSLG